MLFGAAYAKAMAETSAYLKTQFTGENEWYTPSEYLEIVREFFGGTIELDAASSDAAQEEVRARTYFTKVDDALARNWFGRVWLNPPYSQPEIAHFVTKLVREFSAKRVTEAILLTHNFTDTAWFHETASAAAAICFTKGRIKFYNAAGLGVASTQGSAFTYFGNRWADFAAHFMSVGFVVRVQCAEPEQAA